MDSVLVYNNGNFIEMGKVDTIEVDNKKEAFNRAMIKNTLILVPVLVVSIIFTFNSWLPVFSFGMVMFWGLILIAVYNITVTKALLKLRENK